MAGKRMEEWIEEVLQGGAQKNALDFAAFLREKDAVIPEAETYWEIKYHGECVCFLWIDGASGIPGPWTIWSAQVPGTWAAWGSREYKDFPMEQRMKEIAWEHVNVCGNCGGCDNVGGTRKTVLGREFEHLCNSTMAFTDPSPEALECAKKMVETRLEDIRKGN